MPVLSDTQVTDAEYLGEMLGMPPLLIADEWIGLFGVLVRQVHHAAILEHHKEHEIGMKGKRYDFEGATRITLLRKGAKAL